MTKISNKLKKKILFIAIFTVVGLIAWQIPISKIIGSEQKFTLFETMAPIGGMIIGPLLGALSALFVRLANLILDNQSFDLLTIIRFLPMMLAAFYFGTKNKKLFLIPLACIILFNLHPVGRQAWLYSMLWLIPVSAAFLKKRLILNSLGATFTAHAVGSTIFLYAFQLTPAIWMGLIPVALMERGFFAFGIWVNYLIINSALDFICKRFNLPVLEKLVNQEYLISKKFIKNFA